VKRSWRDRVYEGGSGVGCSTIPTRLGCLLRIHGIWRANSRDKDRDMGSYDELARITVHLFPCGA